MKGTDMDGDNDDEMLARDLEEVEGGDRVEWMSRIKEIGPNHR